MAVVTSSQADRLAERARRVMTGGVTAGGRYNPVIGRPFYLDRADGCRVWDVDGNEYIDMSSSNGASMLGFDHPRINAAVQRAMDLGTMCSHETRYHVDLCERLTEIVPSAERVRLVNTGAEATTAAIRIARAATGRLKILKFEGHYHGWHDQLVFNAHTPDRPYEPIVPSFPDSDGIPSVLGEFLVNVPFNDEAALRTALDLHGPEIAAVILEPVAYNMGAIPSDPDWLRLLRTETERRGIVLIFDEVISGFRMTLGGAQAYFGVTPDLTTLAKALGAGWPIAAVAGKAPLMDVLNPIGRTLVPGTYSGHLAGVMASLEALDIMSAPGFYDRLNGVAAMLYSGLDRLFAESGVPGHVQGLGARFGLFFGPGDRARDYRSARMFDRSLNDRFLRACGPAGLHFHDWGAKLTPMHYGITAAHEPEDIEEVLARLAPILASLAIDDG